MPIFDSMFAKGSIPVLEQSIRFAGLRHRVIANNIANIDTPDYKAQDMPVAEFQRVMLRALEEQRRRPVHLFRIDSAFEGVGSSDGGPSPAGLVFPATGVLKHDGNNVSIDLEMSKLARNALLQDSLLQLLRHQYNLMLTAIAERVTA